MRDANLYLINSLDFPVTVLTTGSIPSLVTGTEPVDVVAIHALGDQAGYPTGSDRCGGNTLVTT